MTLGKMLTEAHRGQADYCEPEACQFSQSSLSVVFDGSGKPDGERNVDQSVVFGVTRNTYSAHSKFSENTQAEKVVDGSGKPDERYSSSAQTRTLLEEQRQMIIRILRENWSSRTPGGSRGRRAPTSAGAILAAKKRKLARKAVRLGCLSRSTGETWEEGCWEIGTNFIETSVI